MSGVTRIPESCNALINLNETVPIPRTLYNAMINYLAERPFIEVREILEVLQAQDQHEKSEKTS